MDYTNGQTGSVSCGNQAGYLSRLLEPFSKKSILNAGKILVAGASLLYILSNAGTLFAQTPEKAPGNYRCGGRISYCVTKGDTLTAIAKQFGTTVKDLVKLNPQLELRRSKYLKGENYLRINDKLIIMDGGEPAPNGTTQNKIGKCTDERPGMQDTAKKLYQKKQKEYQRGDSESADASWQKTGQDRLSEAYIKKSDTDYYPNNNRQTPRTEIQKSHIDGIAEYNKPTDSKEGKKEAISETLYKGLEAFIDDISVDTIGNVSKKYGISESTANNWLHQYEKASEYYESQKAGNKGGVFRNYVIGTGKVDGKRVRITGIDGLSLETKIVDSFDGYSYLKVGAKSQGYEGETIELEVRIGAGKECTKVTLKRQENGSYSGAMSLGKKNNFTNYPLEVKQALSKNDTEFLRLCLINLYKASKGRNPINFYKLQESGSKLIGDDSYFSWDIFNGRMASFLMEDHLNEDLMEQFSSLCKKQLKELHDRGIYPQIRENISGIISSQAFDYLKSRYGGRNIKAHFIGEGVEFLMKEEGSYDLYHLDFKGYLEGVAKRSLINRKNRNILELISVIVQSDSDSIAEVKLAGDKNQEGQYSVRASRDHHKIESLMEKMRPKHIKKGFWERLLNPE